MGDIRSDLASPDADLVAAPTCCPGGACGPIFETPLLELAFNRFRDFVGNRRARAVAEPSAAPALDPMPATTPSIAPPPPRPRKDASHD